MSLLQVGLALLDWSVSGGVGIMNCVPVRLSGFLIGDSSSGAGRFLGLVFGKAGEDAISSICRNLSLNKTQTLFSFTYTALAEW